MARYIDLNSEFRDREVYPNENDYKTVPVQTRAWRSVPDNARPLSHDPLTRTREFKMSVSVVELTLPYSDAVNNMARIYVNIDNVSNPSSYMIDTMTPATSNSKFICTFDRYQDDNLGNHQWIHYKCNMKQIFRFRVGEPVSITIADTNGTVLTQQDTNSPTAPDSTKQTFCTIRVSDFTQDGEFTNHFIQPL